METHKAWINRPKSISSVAKSERNETDQTNRIFRLRTPVNVGKRLPKAFQKTNQNYSKPLWNNVKALWRRILGARTKKS